MRKPKLAILGLGKKALDVIGSVCSEHIEYIEFVVVGRDSAIANDYSFDICKLCEANNIKVVDRADAALLLSRFSGYKIAIGWRWIIDDMDKLVVFHDSLLPKYRGFAPVVNSLINGETTLGATALFASEEYDKGNIIAQRSTEIEYPIKIDKAIDIVGALYVGLFDEIFSKIIDGSELVGFSQDESNASYSIWRDHSDYYIDWRQSGCEIKRFIDAVGDPYNGALSKLDDKLVVINDVEIVADVDVCDRMNAIGKVIFIKDGLPVVVCGDGLLKILSATYQNGISIFPLQKFRSRFY